MSQGDDEDQAGRVVARRWLAGQLEAAERETRAAQARGDGAAVARWKVTTAALEHHARRWLEVGLRPEKT